MGYRLAYRPGKPAHSTSLAVLLSYAATLTRGSLSSESSVADEMFFSYRACKVSFPKQGVGQRAENDGTRRGNVLVRVHSREPG